MSKIKTTRKSVINNSLNLKNAGYCDLQSLLRFHDPIAYTSGIYGWNFDVYHVYNLTICTGYRGMPGERLENVEAYEKTAFNLNRENLSFEEIKEQTENLLKKLCVENGGSL